MPWIMGIDIAAQRSWHRILTMPSRRAEVAVALKLSQPMMEEGKGLTRYFSVSCNPIKTNGG